jgi:hypothetical protein
MATTTATPTPLETQDLDNDEKELNGHPSASTDENVKVSSDGKNTATSKLPETPVKKESMRKRLWAKTELDVKTILVMMK